MARPTQNGRTRAPGFAPRTAQAPGLGVYAPLDVRAAPSSAEQFAKMLGLAVDTAMPILEQKGIERAKDDTVRGMADAQAGTLDAEEQKRNEFYARGAKKIAVDKQAQNALSEWREYYQQLDKTQYNGEQVSAEFNQFMSQRLAAFQGDPEAAGWLLNRLGPIESKLRDQHDEARVEQLKIEAVSVTGQNIREDLQAGLPVNADRYVEDLIASGAAANFSEANTLYVEMIGQLAIESAAPELLDELIPERWASGAPGPRSVPALAEAINKARFYAQSAKDAEESEARALAKAAGEQAQIDAMRLYARGDIAGGNAILDDAAAKGQLDASAYRSGINFGQGQLNYWRGEAVDTGTIAALRLDVISNPDSWTPQRVNQEIIPLFPNGPEGRREALQFLDDYERARSGDNLPRPAKVSLDAFKSAYKPDNLASPEQKEAYAASILVWHETFERTQSETEATAAATQWLQMQPTPTVLGTERLLDNERGRYTGTRGARQNVARDVQSLAVGGMAPETFKARYSDPEDVDRLVAALERGDILESEFDRAIAALQ